MLEITNRDYVRTLSLDDAASFNSISEELAGALHSALDEAAEDSSVRALVLTGKGKFFSAGGNLKSFMSQSGPLDDYINQAIDKVYNPLARRLRDMPKPVVSAVNGPAIGAGVGLALSTDIVFAASAAYFSLPFVPKLGVVPDMGSSWLVTRGLSYQQALVLFLTGAPLSAKEAQQAGLIYKCVEDEKLQEQAAELAAQLASLSPGAIRRTKESLRAVHANSFEQQLELERRLQTESFGGKAFQEGLASFREKRPADFVAHGDD